MISKNLMGYESQNPGLAGENRFNQQIVEVHKKDSQGRGFPYAEGERSNCPRMFIPFDLRY